MAIYHLLYRTTTPGLVPASINMPDGRLALNTADERIYFKNASGSIVQPQPRPHLHTVSDISNITLTGGTTGQVLTKNSNTDLDFGWANAGSATVPDASTSVKGIVQLATDTEVATGTDTAKAVVSASVRAAARMYRNVTENTAASAAIPATSIGGVYRYTGATTATFTLPSVSSVQVGQTLTVQNFGSDVLTINAFSGQQIVGANAFGQVISTGTSVALKPFVGTAEFIRKDSSTWNVVVLGYEVRPDSTGRISASVVPPILFGSDNSTTFTLGTSTAGANRYLKTLSTTAVTLNIPAGASGIRIGDELTIRQGASGTVTIVPASGVNVYPPFGGSLVLAGEGATAKLKCVGTDEYDLWGDTAAP